MRLALPFRESLRCDQQTLVTFTEKPARILPDHQRSRPKLLPADRRSLTPRNNSDLVPAPFLETLDFTRQLVAIPGI